MEYQTAQMIAVQGIAFLAQNDEELSRFVALSGLDAADLRLAAHNDDILCGVLDFFLGFEPTLLRFAQEQEIAPEDIAIARQTLGGDSAAMEW